jgi:formate hydrogenlyase transcriptional activator
LVSNLECSDLFRTVSASIRQVMRCDTVGVWLPDIEQAYVRQVAMDFPEGKGFVREGALHPVEGSLIGEVFKTGKPLILGAMSEQMDPDEAPDARAEALESGCALPLISRGRTVGVLTLASRVENSFSTEDVEFLMQAAGQVAIAIENGMAYREIAELKDKLAQEKLYLEDEIRGEMDFEGIVGQSSALRLVLNLVETVASSDSTVLLLGETGTGKELIARAIHERSRRKERTFVKLNCAAIPTGLLESELFGHERGAFTGAIAQKIGRLELADQGTLFLDEVGDIPIEIQPKLLRALQEREFERLGNNRTKKVDVRLVAATNRNLEQMMESHEFRSDLYYRLNVFPIRIPPLRERPEDIPLLVRYFAQKYGRRMQKQIESIPSATLKKLSAWHWPGNIRELENFIERSVILTQGTALQAPIAALSNNGASAPVTGTREASARDEIIRVLKITNGRIAGPDGAAARMDIKRTTLISRMKKLGIDPRRVS